MAGLPRVRGGCLHEGVVVTVNRVSITVVIAVCALGSLLAGCGSTTILGSNSFVPGVWLLKVAPTPSFAPAGTSDRAVIAECEVPPRYLQLCDGAHVVVTSQVRASSTYSVSIAAPELSSTPRAGAPAVHVESDLQDGAFYVVTGFSWTHSGKVLREYIAVTSFRGHGRGDHVRLVWGLTRPSFALPVGKP